MDQPRLNREHPGCSERGGTRARQLEEWVKKKTFKEQEKILLSGLGKEFWRGPGCLPDLRHRGSATSLRAAQRHFPGHQGPIGSWRILSTGHQEAPCLSPQHRGAITVQPEGSPDVPELTSYFSVRESRIFQLQSAKRKAVSCQTIALHGLSSTRGLGRI